MAIYDELLRPCTVCGHKAHMRYFGGWIVECRKCHLMTPLFDSQWEAIKRWNT